MCGYLMTNLEREQNNWFGMLEKKIVVLCCFCEMKDRQDTTEIESVDKLQDDVEYILFLRRKAPRFAPPQKLDIFYPIWMGFSISE